MEMVATSVWQHHHLPLMLYREILDYTQDAILLADDSGRYIDANRAACDLLGYSREELLQRTVTDLAASNAAEVAVGWQKFLDIGRMEGEYSLIRKDGALCIIEYRATARVHPGVHLSVLRDITAQRRSEQDLLSTREQYELLAESLPHLCWIMRPDRSVEYINHMLQDYTGLDLQQLNQQSWIALVHPQDLPRLIETTQGPISRGESHQAEYRLRTKDGSYRWVISRAVAKFDRSGEVSRWIGTTIDIHDRKVIEEQLREREARLRLVLEQMPIGCMTKDLENRITSWNPVCEQIFGWSPEEVLGKRPFDLYVPPEAQPYVEKIFAEMIIDRQPREGSNPNQTRDGRTIWCRWHNSPLIDPEGQLVGFLAMAQDETALRMATAEKQESLRLYRLLADGMQDIIFLLDQHGQGQYCSPSCERVLGYTPEEFLEQGVFSWGHPDDLPEIQKCFGKIHQGRNGMIEWRCRHRNGTWHWLESSANPIRQPDGTITGVICCTREIGHRKKIEEQLRQTGKLEAIGKLAGGVAHDFNNLLTVIIGCAEIALMETGAYHSVNSLLKEILDSGKRGAGLTRQLLAFSRQQVVRPEILSPNLSISQASNLFKRLIGEDIQLTITLDPELGSIRVDRSQFEQILLNLIINARDAMPQGGQLSIRTQQIFHVTDELKNALPDLQGPYVEITIQDSGCGMSEEVKSRLFEPFFTTKPVGKGTGLGLATVYGIIRQANGIIDVQSELQQGTTFRLYLPAHEPLSPAPSVTRVLPEKSSSNPQTILVVEDEPSVRSLTAQLLLRAGFQVLEAESAQRALAICQERSEPPDLLLTDVVMPEINGRRLAEALQERYPALPVLYLSGYTSDTVVRHGIEEDQVAFLQKPYRPDDLLNAVRQTLRRR